MRAPWIALTGIAVGALVAMTLLLAGIGVDDKLRTLQVESCQRGNMVRAYLRTDARLNARRPDERGATADRMFPLLDCPATVEAGRAVPLPPSEQTRLLSVLK